MARKHSYNQMTSLFAYAQLGSDWTGWLFRTISLRQAILLESLGEAKAVTRKVNGQVVIVGYQRAQPEKREGTSPATLTFGTMKAVANSVGKQVQLTPHERSERFKFDVWPLIGDTKAVAVRPRISDQDRRRAEKLLEAPKTMRTTPASTSRQLAKAA